MRLLSKHIPLRRSRQHRLDSALAEFSRRAGTCDSPEEVYSELNRVLAGLLKYDRLAIRTIDDDWDTATNIFLSGEPIPSIDQHVDRTIANDNSDQLSVLKAPLVIADCSDSAVLARYPNLKDGAAELPSLAGVPLSYHGDTVGYMIIRSRKKGAFSDRDVEILGLAAAHVVPTVVNAAQLAELQRDVRERTLLADIGRSVSSTIDFSLVWDEFVRTVQSLVPCDRLVMAIVEEDGKYIEDRYIWGVPIPNWDDRQKHSFEGAPTERVLVSRHSEIISTEDFDQISLELTGYKLSERTGLHSTMFVPLIAGDRLIGSLNVKALRRDAYTKDDLALLERLAMQVGGSVAAAELYTRTVRLAEEKEARAEVELRNKKLTESNESRTRFISAISHELRTPLTSIIAFVDILRRRKKDVSNEKNLQYLDVIRRNAERLRVLIEDLLDLSSVESEDLRLNGTEFNLQDAVAEVTMSLKPMIEARAQRLETEYAKPAIRLVTDRSRLDQILINLITNASKYSGDYKEIKIVATQMNDTVRIAVTDQGDGMTEEESAVIFDEFTRLDNVATNSTSGQGLGLAVSQQLARALGGEVTVSSKKGKGSVFVLTIPALLEMAA